MTGRRLAVLSLSPLPASPPRFGAQARIHGLVTEMARRHDVTCVALVDSEFDAPECERAMREYCREVVLVPNPHSGRSGQKRLLQLRSLASPTSYERHLYSVPQLDAVVRRLLARQRFDVVNVEFPYLAHLPLRASPPRTPPPAVVLDAHEIAHDLARQIARRGGLVRRAYGAVNWRKLRREERAAFRAADGVTVCSGADEVRLLAEVPSVRTAIIPNAADVDRYRPRPTDPPDDGRTIVFFGHLSTVPNIDGATFLAKEIWPLIASARPDARLRIIGPRPHASVLALAAPGIEVVGPVEDLRPHLASAAVVVVPLRVGGGTRLKIVEAMAMGKAIVSTPLGAEGIDALSGRDLVIADDAGGLALAMLRALEDADLRRRLGAAARDLAVAHYSWAAVADRLDAFVRGIVAERAAATSGRTSEAPAGATA